MATTTDKKGGAVFINDPVINDVREYVNKRGASMSWFLARSARYMLRRIAEDPNFMEKVVKEEEEHEGATTGE